MNNFVIVPNPYSPLLVERGTVTQTLIHEDKGSVEITEISLLEMSPKSKIKLPTSKHQSVFFMDVNSNTGNWCCNGETQYFENEYDKPLKLLLLRKYSR